MRDQSAFFIEKIGNHFGFEFIFRNKAVKLRDMIHLPIRTVIDVGANDGGSAKRFERLFRNVRCIVLNLSQVLLVN